MRVIDDLYSRIKDAVLAQSRSEATATLKQSQHLRDSIWVYFVMSEIECCMQLDARELEICLIFKNYQYCSD